MTIRNLLFASFFLTACTAEMTDEPLRGPIGKADLVGSCSADDCGSISGDGTCFCDDECVTFGDCCSNKAEVCEPAEPQSCGGHTIGPAPTCGEGEYCHYEPELTCGFADAAGVCMPMPEACTKIFMPVCGCDGQTYSNGCMAHAAGTSVLHEGSCEPTTPPVQTCGGIAGLTCPDDQFCNYAPEDMCGAADHLGTCTDKPEVCIQLFAPVCGCDGQTYSNSCMAAGSGVSVIHDGACDEPADIQCGGFAGLQCPAGLECVDDPNDDCSVDTGGADCGGICVAI